MDAIDRFLHALGAIEPEALRRLAAHLPHHRAVFEGLADALVHDPVEGGRADPLARAHRLKPALERAAASVELLSRSLVETERRVRADESLRTRLRAMLRPFVEGAADHERLFTLLSQAELRLADDAPWEAARRTQAAATALVEALAACFADPPRDISPEALTRRHAALVAVDAELRTAPDRLGEVLTLLERARAQAEAVDHGLRGPLALATARLRAALDPADGSRAAWQQTFDRAVDADDLEVALEAGRRVQADALGQGEHRRAGRIAHDIAALAQRTGATEVGVVARLEQALAGAREASGADDARHLAEQALEAAEAVGGPVLAQGRLMAGQLFDHLGDRARARALFRAALAQGEVPGAVPPAIVGRAACELGRSLHAEGRDAAARAPLERALAFALRSGDVRLQDAALGALLTTFEAPPAAAARELLRVRPSDPALRAALARRFGDAEVTRWSA